MLPSFHCLGVSSEVSHQSEKKYRKRVCKNQFALLPSNRVCQVGSEGSIAVQEMDA